DGDVNDLGFGHQGTLRRVVIDAVGLDNHLDGDRRAADSDQFCIEAYQITHKDRGDEDDLVHGFGDDLLAGVFAGLDGRCDVDVTQDDSAENGAVCVSVFGHEHD